MFCAIALAIVPITTDDWPGPRVANVFSENGEHFVRILPGSSVGDTEGFRGAKTGRYARGLFYSRQSDMSYKLIADVALQNPVAPVEGLVSNAGFLLTFDNWHNVGYGRAVAVYDSVGKLVRSHSIEELYSPERLRAIPRSVSSRWWRCSPHGYVDPDKQTEVYVFEHFGGTFVFSLSTGAFTYSAGKAKCNPPRGPLSASWFSE